MTCPACSSTRLKATAKSAISTCLKCDAIFGQCYLGDSYSLVLPFFVTEELAPGTSRYFDFTCLGSEGITRRHGWYDPATRRIVQTG